jgi:hypothetical protein
MVGPDRPLPTAHMAGRTATINELAPHGNCYAAESTKGGGTTYTRAGHFARGSYILLCYPDES